MKRIFLPDKPQTSGTQTFWKPEELRHFRQQYQALVKRADSMANSRIPKDDVRALAKDTYAFTVQLFERKLTKGMTLLPEEQAVFALCENELKKYHNGNTTATAAAVCQVILPERSMRKTHSNAAALIRNSLEELSLWFDLSTAAEQADRCIVNAGNVLLPHYAELVRGFFTDISELFLPFLTASAFEMLEAQAECALFYQDNGKTVDKPMASEMLTVAGYARQGLPEAAENGFVTLSNAEIPETISVLYDEASGLLTGARGLRVWLGKKDDSIAVSFSGTDFRNWDMVYADIVQLSEPSMLYLKAAGLLRLLLEHIPGQRFYVSGHSLGGGLAQFSLTANMLQNTDRLTGYAYNPAGLSMVSLKHLEDARLKAAAKKMWVFMTCHDIVSAIGGKIGCLTTLPETDTNGHGMDALQACMKKYLDTP